MSDDIHKKKRDVEVLVVQFLVPVYDRDGKPYRRSVQKAIRRDLENLFGGWSLSSDKPLPGAWRNPASGEVEYDDSWRYEWGSPSRASTSWTRTSGSLHIASTRTRSGASPIPVARER